VLGIIGAGAGIPPEMSNATSWSMAESFVLLFGYVLAVVVAAWVRRVGGPKTQLAKAVPRDLPRARDRQASASLGGAKAASYEGRTPSEGAGVGIERRLSACHAGSAARRSMKEGEGPSARHGSELSVTGRGPRPPSLSGRRVSAMPS
jgi:hypothetical protein